MYPRDHPRAMQIRSEERCEEFMVYTAPLKPEDQFGSRAADGDLQVDVRSIR
jgi:hypothetical protein